jgi:hypothetical protein
LEEEDVEEQEQQYTIGSSRRRSRGNRTKRKLD